MFARNVLEITGSDQIVDVPLHAGTNSESYRITDLLNSRAERSFPPVVYNRGKNLKFGLTDPGYT
jgi:hypothetical protein